MQLVIVPGEKLSILACTEINRLIRDYEKLYLALDRLQSWFKVQPGALTAREHLLDGCPNDLAGAIEQAQKAIADAKRKEV